MQAIKCDYDCILNAQMRVHLILDRDMMNAHLRVHLYPNKMQHASVHHPILSDDRCCCILLVQQRMCAKNMLFWFLGMEDGVDNQLQKIPHTATNIIFALNLFKLVFSFKCHLNNRYFVEKLNPRRQESSQRETNKLPMNSPVFFLCVWSNEPELQRSNDCMPQTFKVLSGRKVKNIWFTNFSITCTVRLFSNQRKACELKTMHLLHFISLSHSAEVCWFEWCYDLLLMHT